MVKDYLIFLQRTDISKVSADHLTQLAIAAICGSPADKATEIMKTIKEVTHFPTYLFWLKMERFLRGTFHSYEDQVKMASRFDSDSNEYSRFAEDLIFIINQVEKIEKIDWFAALTRAFLIVGIDRDLYFKLAKYLLSCTYNELSFIKNQPYNFESKNTVMISALYQNGLAVQITKKQSNNTVYIFSDFVIALKQNCLNFDEGVDEMKRLKSYSELEPLSIPEPMTSDDIDQILSSIS